MNNNETSPQADVVEGNETKSLEVQKLQAEIALLRHNAQPRQQFTIDAIEAALQVYSKNKEDEVAKSANKVLIKFFDSFSL